ncbi:MAG: hypothetical protein AAFX46_15775 [Cyanobacteria bacterium J06636_27]
MRPLILAFVTLMISCGSPNESTSELNPPKDTVLIKIGLHEDATELGNQTVAVTHLNGDYVTRLYADSTYELRAINNLGIQTNIFAASDMLTVLKKDSTYSVITLPLDSGLTKKVKIGHLTDTSTNVLLFHFKLFDPKDSTVKEWTDAIDTIATTTIKLFGR